MPLRGVQYLLDRLSWLSAATSDVVKRRHDYKRVNISVSLSRLSTQLSLPQRQVSDRFRQFLAVLLINELINQSACSRE